eukprot:CAMPEP_0115143846 /NCGR_PEP_ID=MMETSP0227-20121206/61026_1 /TAXON_ID=89957 /ORGANISM="Polarella glacialis, Strain CCMP 1383" /LENGTH=225 /DNA_ID=CAMNT_0002552777 /DNA_START=721 /DNA_END=1397 /DNA_ORIENTATION=-
MANHLGGHVPPCPDTASHLRRACLARGLPELAIDDLAQAEVSHFEHLLQGRLVQSANLLRLTVHVHLKVSALHVLNHEETRRGVEAGSQEQHQVRVPDGGKSTDLVQKLIFCQLPLFIVCFGVLSRDLWSSWLMRRSVMDAVGGFPADALSFMVSLSSFTILTTTFVPRQEARYTALFTVVEMQLPSWSSEAMFLGRCPQQRLLPLGGALSLGGPSLYVLGDELS